MGLFHSSFVYEISSNIPHSCIGNLCNKTTILKFSFLIPICIDPEDDVEKVGTADIHGVLTQLLLMKRKIHERE